MPALKDTEEAAKLRERIAEATAAVSADCWHQRTEDLNDALRRAVRCSRTGTDLADIVEGVIAQESMNPGLAAQA
eukprot:5103347-Lingulodinium_polyedra.AAC.1